MLVRGYAAEKPAGILKPFEYDSGPLGDNQVGIKVEYCGICHSDISMLDNEWGMTAYPFVPGHEVIGIADAVGSNVTTIKPGQRVGLGWYSGSCMTCEWCQTGNHHLCPSAQQTIVGRYGGFADRVRADAGWVFPIPDGLDAESAGPLFCGGITVFTPLVQFDVRPTDRAGVIGIGGLGHLAIRFLDAWGCEVTAFSSSPEKEKDARAFGADHFIDSRNPDMLKSVANSFDFIISTVNAPLDWNAYIGALRPKGRLHFVGVVLEALAIGVFGLGSGQKSVSGSPVGSPPVIRKMLDFVVLHKIKPAVETFPLVQINEAFEHLRSGKARYRVVMKL